MDTTIRQCSICGEETDCIQDENGKWVCSECAAQQDEILEDNTTLEDKLSKLEQLRRNRILEINNGISPDEIYN